MPTLRPYQRNAVRWMLSQEMPDVDKLNTDKKTDNIHPLYEEVRTKEGTTFYYNRVGGFLVREKPILVKSPPGGKNYVQ